MALWPPAQASRSRSAGSRAHGEPGAGPFLEALSVPSDPFHRPPNGSGDPSQTPPPVERSGDVDGSGVPLDQLVDTWIDTLAAYWMRPSEVGATSSDGYGRGDGLIDPALEQPASCATSFQVAALCLAGARRQEGPRARARARAIVQEAARRQHPDGSLEQPYYARRGEPGVVDIAEIGACGRALYFLAQDGDAIARRALERAAGYLVSQAHPDRPGVVYKRPDATHHDVLNGDAYAGDTFFWASEATGNPEYRARAAAAVRHLAQRFGKVTPGWWPYAEDWQGQPTMGNNVAYQGTVVAFTAPWYDRLGDPDLTRQYGRIVEEAVQVIVAQLQRPPEARDEDRRVWWAIADRMTWETALALWHARDRVPEGAKILYGHLRQLYEAWQAEGPRIFDPPGNPCPDPDRYPVTSRFRRLATASGALAYMALDPRR